MGSMDFASDDKRHKSDIPGFEARSEAVERFLRRPDMPPLLQSVIGGAAAGIVGGVLMTIVLMWSYVSSSQDPLLPLRLAVLNVVGSVALASGLAGPVVGLMLNVVYGLAAGIAFGVVMATSIGKLHVLAAAGVGAIYGLLVWIVCCYVIVPYAAPRIMIVYEPAYLALAHVIYGICLGLFGSAYVIAPRQHRSNHR